MPFNLMFCVCSPATAIRQSAEVQGFLHEGVRIQADLNILHSTKFFKLRNGKLAKAFVLTHSLVDVPFQSYVRFSGTRGGN